MKDYDTSVNDVNLISLENNPQLKLEVENLIKKKVGFWVFMARLSFVYNLIIFLVIIFSGGYFFSQIWPLIDKLSQTQAGIDSSMNKVKDIFSGMEQVPEITPKADTINDVINLIQGEDSQ